MIDIKKLKVTKQSQGFFLCEKPRIDCDWSLVKAEPLTSTRYVCLKTDTEVGKYGAGNDFIDTGLMYICSADENKEISQIDFSLAYLPKGKSFQLKAVFLDRDGILIYDTCFPGRRSDVVFNSDILPLLTFLKEAGYIFVVVTNQSGIARGKYTMNDYHDTTKFIKDHYEKNGITLEKTYCCPFHIDGELNEYKKESGFRKPSPGMLLLAAEELGIDLSSSIMIGDKESDRIELGCLRSFVINKNQKADFAEFDELLLQFKKALAKS